MQILLKYDLKTNFYTENYDTSQTVQLSNGTSNFKQEFHFIPFIIITLL